jgi:hypothetical protein
MTTNKTNATDRQLDTIETESRRAGFASPQDAADAAGISSRNWRYDLNRSDASDLIAQLRGGLTPPVEPEMPATYVQTDEGMSAVDALTVLGRVVTVHAPSGAKHGKVVSIEPSQKDGTPALTMLLTNGKTGYYRLSVITGWAQA